LRERPRDTGAFCFGLDPSRFAAAIAEKEPPWARPSHPFAGVWESEIVPMLEAAPGIRAVATFEEPPTHDKQPKELIDAQQPFAKAGGNSKTHQGPSYGLAFSQRCIL
jgi:hypothetical protein